MLNDLQTWFFWDATTLSTLVIVGVTVVSLVVFYALLRKKDKAPESDPYEEFLAEEFKLTLAVKPAEFLELPQEPKVMVFEESIEKKPAAKKPAKKKAAKKAAKKKVAKAKVTSAK